MNKLLRGLCLLIALSMALGAAPVMATETAPAAARTAEAMPAPAPTAEDSPSATPTATPIPTQTPEPTATPTPVPTPVASLPIDLSPGYGPRKDAYNEARDGYDDGTIMVRIYPQRVHNTNCHYVHVKIRHASQMRTAASRSFTSQAIQRAADIARRYQAVVAINGDYFAFDNYGFVVRQGHQYRNRPSGEDVLIVDDRGDFHPLIAPEKSEEIDAFVAELGTRGRTVINAFTFGPVLVREGETIPVKNPYFGTAPNKRAQRMGIAQLGPLEYMIVTTEGPEDRESKGLLLAEFSELMRDSALALNPQGCLVGYNLDGGSSNTLYFDGRKFNSPTGKTRSISDIIYFSSLVP